MKRTPLKRGGPLRRKTRLKPRNEERAAKRRAEDFGPQAEICRELPCAVCLTVDKWRPPTLDPASFLARLAGNSAAGCTVLPISLSDPHHEPSRGAGGTDRDTVPLCREHHRERHTMSLADFEEKYGVDLRKIAHTLSEEIARND